MLLSSLFLGKAEGIFTGLAATAFLLIPTYIATFLVGIPVHYLLQDIGYKNVLSYVIGGYIISSITVFIFFYIISSSMSATDLIRCLAFSFFNIFNVAGIIAGAVFWHIVVRSSRPNKSSKPTPHSGAA